LTLLNIYQNKILKTLIVTAAGLSTRFENLKPKWMLTHPNGNWMIVESLKNLDFSSVSQVYLVFLREHIEKYKCHEAIKKCLQEIGIQDKAKIIILNKKTHNQPHTVYEAIKQANIKGQVIIKEVDNKFSYSMTDGNFMCYYDLNNTTCINPSNKSYIKINKDNIITDIVEKRVVSSTFGCGSYSFESAVQYIKYFEKKANQKTLYLSDIIKVMIQDNFIFKAIEAKNYVDWGTKEDWFKYIRSYKTLFVDIDGVLVKGAGGKYLKPYWGESKGIPENIDFLSRIHQTGKVLIILTTARPESFKEKTIEQLKRESVPYDKIIFDLLHCNRTIINDYGSSNPYPTCDAVNISRNSNDLERFLKDLGK